MDKKKPIFTPPPVQVVPGNITIDGRTFEQKTIAKNVRPGLAYVPPILAINPGVYINTNEATITANETPFYIFLDEVKPIIPLYFAAVVQELTTGALLFQMNVPFYNVLFPDGNTDFSSTLKSQMKYQFLSQFAQVYTTPVSSINWELNDFLRLDAGQKIIWGGSPVAALSAKGSTIPVSGQWASAGPFAAGNYNISTSFNYLVMP
jgi:hypothetical protein